MMKISLIIATYNQPDYLELVLKSVLNQSILPNDNLEVLIADDGSNIVTKNLIDEYKQKSQFKIKHIWHEDLGFRLSAIRNLAILNAKGDYLLFVDGDCILPIDFVAQQAKIAELGYFVAGNRVLLSEQYTKKLLKTKCIDFINNSPINWIFAKYKKETNKLFHWLRFSATAKFRKLRKTNWKYPKGCNIAVFKTDIIAVNGFDESFTGWGHEDSDFFVRLLHSGVKIKDGRFAVPVYHLWHKENDKSKASSNWNIFCYRLKDKAFIQAAKGITQHG